MNILHNLITVLSMVYTFIFGSVGAYTKYLSNTDACKAIHNDPKLQAFEEDIVSKLDITHYLSYFLASLMFLNAVLHLVIFVKKLAIIGFLFILVLFVLFIVEIYLIVDLVSIIKDMNKELEKQGEKGCKLQIPNDLLDAVLGLSTGLIFVVVLVSFGIVAYG